MDKTYIKKSINLPEDAAAALDKAKLLLERDMGLRLSYSQTIQVLAVRYTNDEEV